MTCDIFLSQLSALLDGELSPEAAAKAERHLVICGECAQARSEIAELRGMASAWTMDAPDITERVIQAVALDDQKLLLDEMQALKSELQALRAEVVALRRQLSSHLDAPLWTPPTRLEYSRSEHLRMENDPWNLTRS